MSEFETQPVPPVLTERQLRIAERLDELSRALGDLFRSAVSQAQTRRDSSWLRLSAHACRELVNRLPDYLDLPVAGRRLDYADRFRQIAARWPNDPAEQPPPEVIDLLARLVEDDRLATATVRARAEALFEALETGERFYAGDTAARVELWVEMQRYFPSVAHLSAPGVPEPDPELFGRNFARLERLLASQFGAEGYYETQADLDDLLAKAEPDEDDADAVVALLRGELYRSFFERATSPSWLSLLTARGFFRRPPQKIVDALYVRYPGWPEARYLVAIASRAPEEVSEAIIALEPTDNARVHSDLLEAALLMPPAAAAPIAALAGEWLDDSHLMLVADRAGQLVANLADGGEIEASARLARQLLALREVPSQFEAGYGALFDIRARIDEWEYQQFLEKQFPRLFEADPIGALRILRDVLRAAILMERRRWQTERDDGMKIARNRIDEHESFPAIENALVTTLRDASVAHVVARPDELETVLALFNEHPELLFYRLELHLVSEVSAPAAEDVRQRLLLDAEISTHYATEHEYERLLERAFTSLDVAVQRQLIERIEAGPDREHRELVRARIAEDHEPTDAELEERWERWRLRRLTPIKGALDGEDAARYVARVTRYGEPAYPEEQFRSGYVGVTGLLSIEELRAMSSEEIIQTLVSWEPDSNGWEAPTREGQARALDVLINEDPEIWASRAAAFTCVPPVYARHLLQALDSAIRSASSVESWAPLLELAEHLAAQEPGEGAVLTYDDDADYQPARRALTHLLHTALARRIPPFEYRARLWRLIVSLAHDADPTADRDLATEDAAASTINQTRGVALIAAVAYGLWCRHNLDSSSRTFEAMPELRELLEEKLDPDQEPSPGVHAAFGQVLPHLLYLDREWVEEHLDQVFPSAVELAPRRDAAWGSFVRYARCDASTLRLLLPQFRDAITRLPDDTPERLLDIHTRLAEYVGEIYLIDADDPAESVTDQFFARAAAAFRTQAIRHLALAFRSRDITAESRERLTDLWERRLADLAEGDPELADFGWWFSSRQLDEDRSLTLLKATLEKSDGVIDNIKEVVEALVPVAASRQDDVLRSVELLVGGAEWHVLHYARDAIRLVLEAVFETGTEAHLERARRLIHDLGESGVHGMQDLLNTSQRVGASSCAAEPIANSNEAQ